MGPLLGLALQTTPGIISGMANIFGRQRRRQQEDKASQGISQLADLFREQLSGDYFNTPEAQGAITEIMQNQQDNQRMIDNTASVTGMTDEAKIAMMGRNNQATAGGFSNLSRSAELWRNRIQQMYGSQLNNLFQVGQQNRQNFNNSLANILNPLSQAIGEGINAGVFDKKTQKPGLGSIFDNNNLTNVA